MTLHPIAGVSIQYLFARFAQSIFQLVEGFLLRGVRRYLIGTSVRESGSPRWVSSEECTELARFRPRSMSPKKRKAPSRDQSLPEEATDLSSDNSVDHRSTRKRKRLDTDTRSRQDAVTAIGNKSRAVVLGRLTTEQTSHQSLCPATELLPTCTCPLEPMSPPSSGSNQSISPTSKPVFYRSKTCRVILEYQRLGKVKAQALKGQKNRGRAIQTG